MHFEEKTVKETEIFKGKVLKLDFLEVLLPDGNPATREIIRHPGAAAVIPINDKNEIFMVRQYRKPLEKVTLEIPAGKLDRGEDPRVCAERELREETGVTSGKLWYVASIHSTPGFSDEVLHLYAATELTEGESNADEDEFLSVEKIPIGKLLQMIFSGEITDAKSIIGILIAEKIIKGEL